MQNHKEIVLTRIQELKDKAEVTNAENSLSGLLFFIVILENSYKPLCDVNQKDKLRIEELSSQLNQLNEQTKLCEQKGYSIEQLLELKNLYNEQIRLAEELINCFPDDFKEKMMSTYEKLNTQER